MGKIIAFIGAWITKNLLWGVALKILDTIYFFSLVAMTSAFFFMLDLFISRIRAVLAMMTNYGGGSELVGKFYSVLNLLGITQALNDTSGLISSALIFLVSRLLIVNVNKFYRYHRKILSNQVSNK